MTELSVDQEQIHANVKKSARTTGIVVGLLAGLIALWALKGQSTPVWIGGAAGIGLIVAFVIYRWRYRAKSDAAVCESCNAKFAVSRTDHTETLIGTASKQEEEEQENGEVKVTSWTEETFSVTDTYTCAKCGHATTKEYETSRRENVTEEIKPKAPAESAMDQKLARAARAAGVDVTEPRTPVGKGRRSS